MAKLFFSNTASEAKKYALAVQKGELTRIRRGSLQWAANNFCQDCFEVIWPGNAPLCQDSCCPCFFQTGKKEYHPRIARGGIVNYFSVSLNTR